MFELLQTSPVALITVVVVLGLLVGSFLNVVIHRTPKVLAREWRSQSVDIMSEWAQEADAPGITSPDRCCRGQS